MSGSTSTSAAWQPLGKVKGAFSLLVKVSKPKPVRWGAILPSLAATATSWSVTDLLPAADAKTPFSKDKSSGSACNKTAATPVALLITSSTDNIIVAAPICIERAPPCPDPSRTSKVSACI